jgi:hypothetical protein
MEKRKLKWTPTPTYAGAEVNLVDDHVITTTQNVLAEE